MVFLTGCLSQEYTKNKSITKLIIDKYEDFLQKNNVAEMKCTPIKDGYRVYYFNKKKPNDFPATILLERVSGSYNVLFDATYLRVPKENLLEDIDGCFTELEKNIAVDQSWK